MKSLNVKWIKLKESWSSIVRRHLKIPNLTKAQMRELEAADPMIKGQIHRIIGHELYQIRPFFNDKIMSRIGFCDVDGTLTVRGAVAIVSLWDKRGIHQEAADWLWDLIKDKIS
jgi:hypothetical protein